MSGEIKSLETETPNHVNGDKNHENAKGGMQHVNPDGGTEPVTTNGGTDHARINEGTQHLDENGNIISPPKQPNGGGGKCPFFNGVSGGEHSTNEPATKYNKPFVLNNLLDGSTMTDTLHLKAVGVRYVNFLCTAYKPKRIL